MEKQNHSETELHFAPFYQQLLDTLAAYSLALNTMYVDQYTIAPKKGANRANDATAILSTAAFDLENDPQTVQKIEEYAKTLPEGCLEKKEVELRLDQLTDTKNVPSDLYKKYSRVRAQGQTDWHEAKEKSDYSLFRPILEDIVRTTLEVSACSPRFNPEKPYDYLLDKFEKGMNQEEYDRFFNILKEDLSDLVKKVASSKQPDETLMNTSIPVAAQDEFSNVLLDLLKADRARVYLSTTEHPFTDFLSHDDVRITTHYYPDMFLSAILSTVHEYGHALFHLQTDPAFDKTMFIDAVGCAAHESQSRLLENHIGRTKAFWQTLLPELQKRFPAFHDIDADTLYHLVNISRPSLIRTEADELTYPFHVMIRYEIEKKMINGEADFDTLPQVWNDLYEEYLGVRPSNDKEGILQDMHWSDGSIGYFPSYALGSAYAAQLYEAMERDIDPQALLSAGRFDVIAKWLEDNVHHYGGSKTMREIVEEVSGKPFDPHIYTKYLKDKYTELYNLDD